MHEPEAHLRRHLHGLAELDRLELPERCLRLVGRIQRQGGRVLGRLHLVVELGVFFLQMAAVGQHDGAQIDRRRRRIDRPPEALLHQPRNPAAVVQVRMRQDHGLNARRRNRQWLPVALAPFLLPLEQPAVHQHLRAVLARVDQVLGAGHRAGCP